MILGNRNAGAQQFAALKLIPQSAAPTADVTAPALYAKSDGAVVIRGLSGLEYPIAVGQDGSGFAQVAAATYTVLVTDRAIGCNYAGAITLTLPLLYPEGVPLLVFDDSGAASGNAISVTPNALHKIDNGSLGVAYSFAVDNGILILVRRGVNWTAESLGGAAGAVTFAAVQTALAAASGAVTFNKKALTTIGSIAIGPDAATSGVPRLLSLTGAADTAQTASTEKYDVLVASNRTVQWATGALTAQRFSWFRAPTMAFVGASTCTDAATVAIEGPPAAGTNATLTGTWPLWVQAGVSRFDGSIRVGGQTPLAAAADAVSLFAPNVNGAGHAGLAFTSETGGVLQQGVESAAATVTVLRWAESVADDGTISLPLPTAIGFVQVNSYDEGLSVCIKTDGTCVKQSGTTNTDVADTDTKLDVFNATTSVTVRNRLGGARVLLITYTMA